MSSPTIDRRSFVKAVTVAGLAATIPSEGHGATGKSDRFLTGGFTKPFQQLGMDYAETAAESADIGWMGVECPVRPGGQVLPERVEDDLPAMVSVLEKHGVRLLVMASGIHGVDEQYTEAVLRTGASLGVKYYRMGWHRWDLSQSMTRQMRNIRDEFRDLQALNRELGITGLYQNHSGGGVVGGSVWDLFEIFGDLDPRYMAIDFDIGHATVEGGFSWADDFRLVQDMVGGVIVKDFTWMYTPGEGGRVEWCPLGEGMVNNAFFDMLKKSTFNGPVIQHHEYSLPGETDTAKRTGLKQLMRQDHKKLRSLL